MGGLAYAALSAVFNGSWGLLAKLPARRGHHPHPLAFNYWAAEGMAATGLLLLAVVTPRALTAWGALSGLLFILSTACAVFAIRHLGLAVASGVWCGVAVLSSFAFGVLVAGDTMTHWPLAITGLVLLLLGIVGIAVAGHHAAVLQHGKGGGIDESQQELLDSDNSSGACCTQHVALGFGGAVLAGLLGGLILAPMTGAPPGIRGRLSYVPSMALGSLVGAPVLTALLYLGSPTNLSLQALTSEHAMWPGMAAGVVWNVGNCFSILATQDPRTGLAVSYPIMQCGLFVAGVWGIMLFGEIPRGWLQAVYWVSGGVLAAGAALLAAAK